MNNSLSLAFNSFITDSDIFRYAIDTSTRRYYGDNFSPLVLGLFVDGTYQLNWLFYIDQLVPAPDLIIHIPYMDSDQWRFNREFGYTQSLLILANRFNSQLK